MEATFQKEFRRLPKKVIIAREPDFSGDAPP